ncbi:hypothetical protein B0T18DRAFT_426888 [Schizothecium vesticola]|uniref:Uncharacterized protein n=1 Tax=Schizothecium vesticola TaxID=314040 RepID=A0AA40F749_9PEZI|nr:hypothetical protein B0T18DRAFT_426888 [Schizothecium vesticola]
MGLRLYQLPVKSDIQSKPGAAVEKALAQARSSIRRSNARPGHVVQGISQQLRHRSALREAASATAPPDTTDRNATWGLPSDSESSSDAPTTGENTVDDRALRHIRRAGILDDHIVALFGERWAQLHASAAPGPSRDHDDRQPVPPLSSMALGPEFLVYPRRPFSEAYATSSMRSTQAPGHSSRSSYRRVDSEGNLVSRRERMERLRRAVESNTSFDGLGDRNRSLSPEGDHVWDTLLTTISPDPQPPSVGSSFASASASASATASQGAATGSSRTSFTGAIEVDELLASFEPQCESGCETSSDSEGDDDGYEMRPTVAYSRSYADVTRSSGGGGNNDNPVTILGGIGGMQRIVMGLAQREDIPDEWWAEAGLSRTLSRDASTH